MTGLACLLADRSDPFTETLLLELRAVFSHVRLLARGEEIPPSALLLCDLDYATPEGGGAGRCIGYSRELPCDVRRPFRMEELRRLLTGAPTAALLPSADFRTVTVEGETVALTEREAALLALLHRAGGAPIERAALAAVFEGAEDAEGSLSVYIHYLRKKLERNGKRRILAHRGGGYSLLTD